MANRIYDVSMPIYEGMPIYKNRPEKQPEFEVTADFSNAASHESRVHLDVHTGTHIDAPLHMIPDGATTETIGIEQLIRECAVYDLTHVTDGIHHADLAALPIARGEFVLFQTRNSWAEGFQSDFVYLAEDGASYLATLGIAGVGIDALGIERSQLGHPTHKALFGAGAVIIEGLQLQAVRPGRYLLIAAPLKLIGLDAAPARVLLRDL